MSCRARLCCACVTARLVCFYWERWRDTSLNMRLQLPPHTALPRRQYRQPWHVVFASGSGRCRRGFRCHCCSTVLQDQIHQAKGRGCVAVSVRCEYRLSPCADSRRIGTRERVLEVPHTEYQNLEETLNESDVAVRSERIAQRLSYIKRVNEVSGWASPWSHADRLSSTCYSISNGLVM